MLKSKFVFLVSRATRRLKPSLLLSKKRLLSQSLVDAQKMQSEVIPVAPITIAEHDLGFDLSTSSDTPNQTPDENQHRNGSILLGELPSDVILEVFLRLECLDVLSLSQVSRLFYKVSLTLAVWQNLAYRLMCRSRRISLYNQLSINSLTASQLRQSVLTATFAERSWLDPKDTSRAKFFSSIHLTNVDLEQGSYVMKFTSDHHLVLPAVDGGLIGWNTLTGTCAGAYAMDTGEVLINVQPDYATRSLYWITGKVLVEMDNNQNLRLRIIRVQFPESSSSEAVVTFEVLGELVTAWALAIELHFIDASRRMICAVFENNETGNTSLHVILDWETGLSYVFDTDVPYDYGRSVTSLHLSDDGRSIILHSERWGTEIRRSYLLDAMYKSATIWSLELYSQVLNPIFDFGLGMDLIDAFPPPAAFITVPGTQAHPGTANSSGALIPYVAPHVETAFTWAHDRSIFSNHALLPHSLWTLSQWWPTYDGVPNRTCTIVLHASILNEEEEQNEQTKRTWIATQHYSECAPTGDGMKIEEGAIKECITGLFYGFDDQDYPISNDKEERILGGAPCSPVRSVIEIKNPVVHRTRNNDQIPILTQTFNHLGWIEEYVVYEDETTWKDILRSVFDRTRKSRLPSRSTDNGDMIDRGIPKTGLMERLNPRSWFTRRRASRRGRKERRKGVERRVRSLKLVTFPDPGVSPVGSAHPCYATGECGHTRPGATSSSDGRIQTNSESSTYLDLGSGSMPGSSPDHGSDEIQEYYDNGIYDDDDDEHDYDDSKRSRCHSWETEEEGRGGKQKGRCVRDFECTCTTLKPVTLDVPASVLDTAYHMFLDEGTGTVTVVTKDNVLHEYHYGRTYSN